ncbi:hypothetical protein [Bradyrhizobium sp. RT10b]|uniref:hypothetical protein n=1 Tax=Bradyrhizobium sp. RT10b TaxID=3156331 RepID=UPI00339506DE
MSEKPKPISKKIRAAIDALVEGENITAAAAIAGLSREHLSRELGRPHIAALLRQKIERNLAINAAKAGVTKVRLMDSENGMVADRASSFILGLAGISPQTVPAAPSGPASPGVVIQIITHDPGPPMIDVTPAQIEIIRP